jgi:N-acetylated-alpha-linked acidic dipeptidase
LVGVERGFLSPDGLAGRPWYKHTLYAPGSYAGYAAAMMPGLTEAIDRKDIATARHEAAELTAALNRATAALKDAARFAHP